MMLRHSWRRYEFAPFVSCGSGCGVLASRAARAQLYESGRRAIVGATIFAPKTDRPMNTLDAPRRAFQPPSPAHAKAISQRLEPVRIDQSIGNPA